MYNFKIAFIGELYKIKRSRFVWITFLVFALAPVMAGLFMIKAASPDLMSKASAGLKAKAEMFSFSADWTSLLSILSQAIGVGGILIFGFVFSWIFGREYADNTIKDLLALPISRTAIVTAKFLLAFVWCFLLALSNLIVGVLIGMVLNLSGFDPEAIKSLLITYLITSLLTISLNIPVGFLAVYTKGYFGSLGFVAITLVLSQIIAATGNGAYFPWAVPALFSMRDSLDGSPLNYISYVLLFTTSLLGYLLTVGRINYYDQKA